MHTQDANRKYRLKNKEKIADLNRRWREENKDRIKEMNTTWYQRNKEKVILRQREYYKANRDAIIKKQTASLRLRTQKYWYSFVLHEARRRAKKLGVEFDLTKEDIKNIPLVCEVFKTPLIGHWRDGKGRADNKPTLDRINSAGGYTKDNVRIISWRANRLKSDGTLAELEQIVEYMKRNATNSND